MPHLLLHRQLHAALSGTAPHEPRTKGTRAASMGIGDEKVEIAGLWGERLPSYRRV